MPKPQERPFDAGRFVDTNRVRFDPPWAASDIAWWRKRMFEAHGLYPDEYAELLSASSNAIRIATFAKVDRKANAFGVGIVGQGNDGGTIWLSERLLDLDGRLFSAERMFVDETARMRGIGRNLMSDLVKTAVRLNIPAIRIEASDVGRYAWIRFGFLPDRGSWLSLRLEMTQRLSFAESSLTRRDYFRVVELVTNSDPAVARAVAALSMPVPSRHIFSSHGEPLPIALGKAMFLEHGVGWVGSFDLTDSTTMKVHNEYVEG
jgi:GNAT superfamily N-acetyltransferase